MGNCIQRDIVGESGEHIIRSRSTRRSNALSNDTEDTISDIDNNIDYIDIDDDDDNDDNDNNNNSSNNSNSNKKRNRFGWTRNSNKFFSNFQTSNSSTSSLSSSSSSSSFSSSHHRNDNQQQSSSTTLSTSPSHSSRKTCGIVHNYISNHSEEMIKHSLLYSDESIDRLHLMHYILKYIWGKNYISPIEGLLRRGGACVLEIGCGSGTWSLEMGCEYPLTRFYGVELTSIFPTNIKPQNVRFLPINVAENGLPFENDKFDFVYINSLNIVLSEQEWSRVFIEIARVLKPGGLFECMSGLKFFDDQGPKTKRIHLACIDTFSKLEISTPMFKSSKLQRSLENIYQFTNIEAIQKITSIIDWEDNVSDLIKECIMKFMETAKFMILPQLRVSNEEYDLLVKEMLEVEIKEYNSTFASCRLCCKKIVSLDNNIDDY